MNRYFPKNKTALLTVIVLLFAITMFILPCCRKKDQPQQNQQVAEPQDTEQIVASEPAELTTTVETEPTEKIKLSILYAGLLDTDRGKDFTEFLSRHFEKVETTDYNLISQSLSANFDVAIIDHNGLDLKVRPPNIPRNFSGATVTLGVPGAHFCNRLSLKTGYL
jgi:hypothetical protein